MVDQNITNRPAGDHRIGDVPGHAHPEEVGSIPVEGAHGVKYEGSDADTGAVLRVGLVTIALVLVSVVGLIAFYWFLMHSETDKENDLPRAAADRRDDAARLPPQPRLEAIEDLRQPGDSNYQLLPRRAANYLVSQEELLTKGDARHMPIGKAIEALAANEAGEQGKLPAEKKAPPRDFTRRLPSKASSGRLETGGQ